MHLGVGRRSFGSRWTVPLGAWTGVFAFFVVGDLVTTSVGLAVFDLSESGPVTRLLIERYGLWVMVPVKCVVVGYCYFVWRIFPAPYSLSFPAGLTILGVVATGWNLHVLLPIVFG
jgi:uncharacterized integral membrane protein